MGGTLLFRSVQQALGLAPEPSQRLFKVNSLPTLYACLDFCISICVCVCVGVVVLLFTPPRPRPPTQLHVVHIFSIYQSVKLPSCLPACLPTRPERNVRLCVRHPWSPLFCSARSRLFVLFWNAATDMHM